MKWGVLSRVTTTPIATTMNPISSIGLSWSPTPKYSVSYSCYVCGVAWVSADQELNRVSLSTMLCDATKSWQGVKLNQPNWSYNSYGVALGGVFRSEGLKLHLILIRVLGAVRVRIAGSH